MRAARLSFEAYGEEGWRVARGDLLDPADLTILPTPSRSTEPDRAGGAARHGMPRLAGCRYGVVAILREGESWSIPRARRPVAAVHRDDFQLPALPVPGVPGDQPDHPLSTIGKTRDALRDAYAGSNAEAPTRWRDVFYAIGLGSGILLLLLAVGLVVLALFNNQGNNGARITTWVVGGIMVCCVGGGLLSNAAGGFNTGGGTTGDGPSREEIQRRLEEALPSWAPRSASCSACSA